MAEHSIPVSPKITALQGTELCWCSQLRVDQMPTRLDVRIDENAGETKGEKGTISRFLGSCASWLIMTNVSGEVEKGPRCMKLIDLFPCRASMQHQRTCASAISLCLISTPNRAYSDNAVRDDWLCRMCLPCMGDRKRPSKPSR